MPRANRYFSPNHIWHITHRCHKKEFLLKFAKDRQRWRYWLFEAKKRYGLCVLNYIVTSNHVHLLVRDRGEGEIAQSMQLIAGRTAQEYNQRKTRKGAFWEDRYHATAVDSEDYLARCMVYIDLNMVRAGAVKHPAEWDVCGYREIQQPPKRYAIINRKALAELFSIKQELKLQETLAQWVEEALKGEKLQREFCWTDSLAVGHPSFLKEIKDSLVLKGKYRDIEVQHDVHVLREPTISYLPYFMQK
jgi:putative transposase